MAPSKIITRQATMHDVAALTSLMNQLGYPTTVEEMQIRFENISLHEDYRTFVAVYNENIAGMIGFVKNIFYEKNGSYIRIVAMVVDKLYRKKGIGTQLMQRAENWALELNINTMILNSGNREERKEAHFFYQKLGFEQKSIGFVKIIR